MQILTLPPTPCPLSSARVSKRASIDKLHEPSRIDQSGQTCLHLRRDPCDYQFRNEFRDVEYARSSWLKHARHPLLVCPLRDMDSPCVFDISSSSLLTRDKMYPRGNVALTDKAVWSALTIFVDLLPCDREFIISPRGRLQRAQALN